MAKLETVGDARDLRLEEVEDIVEQLNTTASQCANDPPASV